MAEYTSKDITVLQEIEHIRLNPGMYIGNTETPTHLIEECLDNALDESMAGHSKIAMVTIDTKTNTFSVIDNGRGIPIDNDVPLTISTKLFSGGKFKGQKKAYGAACLTGDTKIILVSGEEISIKEMSENPNKEYFGFSSTEDGVIKICKLIAPRLTKYVNETIKITLDNGKTEESTVDHLFLTKSGNFKKAEDLKENESMMPIYFMDVEGYLAVRSNSVIGINCKKRQRKIDFSETSLVKVHRLVYRDFISSNIGYNDNIHHIDGNKRNNNPSNLKLLTIGDHLREHVKINVKSGFYKNNCKQLIEYSKSERGRNKSRENGFIAKKHLLEYVNSDRNKINKSEFFKKYNLKDGIQNDLRKKKLLKYGKSLLNDGLEINEENWELYRPYGTQRFDNIHKYFDFSDFINESSKYVNYYNKLEKTNGKLLTRVKIFSILKRINGDINEDTYNMFRKKFEPRYEVALGLFDSLENMIEMFKHYNHKIVKIERIKYEIPTPVYDLTVPEYENFALSSGIFSHNCGLHGIGLVAVNALSSEFSIEIYRDKKHALYSFKDSKLISKDIQAFKGDIPFSTKIQFKPYKKIFESLVPDIDRIRKRLLLASTEMEKCVLVLSVDGTREIIRLSKDEFFKDHCLNQNDNRDFLGDIVKVESIDGDEKYGIIFQYCMDGNITPKVTSSVNLLPVDQGGTHINIFYDIIKDIFMERAKKLNLKFLPQDCLAGLRVYFSLILVETSFTSQSKERLNNKKEYFNVLGEKLKQELVKYFSKNQNVLDSIVTYFADFRRRMDSKKLKGETHGRRSSTKFTKLKDCSSPNGELFIVEGESAGGGFIDCRDTRIHAVYPLKGKIASIAKNDVLKNKEVSELMQSLGCGIGKDFDINKLRYSKVICAVDADSDGAHIFCLLTMIIANLVPEIIKTGKYYLAMTPLYGTHEGKVFIPIWDDQTLDKYQKLGKNIQRYKGLGELDPDQLKACVIDEKTRKLIKIEYTKNLDELMELFTDPQKKRDLLDTEL